MWKLCKNWGSKRGDDALPPRLTTKLRAKEANKESEGRYWGIHGHYRHQGSRQDMGGNIAKTAKAIQKYSLIIVNHLIVIKNDLEQYYIRRPPNQ